MEKSINMDKLTLGVCYYPEHWSENLWEDDLIRMKEHGIEIIRIAEFAWSKFEPEEGRFTFEFFDNFLELAKKHGIKVIFCTPTATPPAWLTEKYPEVLNSKSDGTPFRHGLRRHYNYNSAKYRMLVSIIVDKIAKHYCPHPSIIGWQIDNEINCEIDVFYSEADHQAFRQYLKDKFKTLDALNEAMGTVFWNQTYSSWDEVYLTRTTIHNHNNPHLALEEKRFFSHSAISFCKFQADIIRKYKPQSQFITTNGLFSHLDSHEMTDSALDFITFDSYPNFAFDTWTEPKKPGNLNDRNWSWNLTKTRSISPNFGIMEQQSGQGGWDFKMKQPAPKPGQMRLWTFQSVAHGADFISYFRWRTCWIGTEIYWHGLNDYSNLPNRRLNELKTIKEDFKKLSCISGSKYKANIAFVKDYDNEWDGEQDKWHGPLDRFSDDGWFAAAQLSHTPMDFLFIRNGARKTTLQDLSKYKLLIYPHATILTYETAQLLKEYVMQGGKLIMGARTGYKDEFGRCPMRPMPGFAEEICGVRVVDYTHLGPGEDVEFADWEGEEIDAPVFNDILEAQYGAKVLATFRGSYYDGMPALISNSLGKGTAYYYGAGFSSKTALVFLKKLALSSPFDSIVKLPEQAEIAVRSKDGVDFLFILNYMPYELEVDIKKPLTDLISEQVKNGKVRLEKFGVMILQN